MIAGIVLFLLFRRALITIEVKKLLLVGRAAARRDFLTGLGLAAVSILLIVTAMTAADIFTPFFRLSASVASSRVAGAAASGLFAGAFEEVFFRGILFMGLRRYRYDFRAYLLTNSFYAVLHFVKPGEAYFINRLDLSAGFVHLAYTFKPFLDPLPLLPGLFGFLLVGAVLSFAVERTGNLLLAIGLHAGWVFGLKTLCVFGDFKVKRGRLGWLFGSSDPKILSGVVTWTIILLTGAAIYFLTKSRAVRSGDLPPAIAV